MSIDGAVWITDDWIKTPLARAIPGCFFQTGSWWLPPLDRVDPEDARKALRLFPTLHQTCPELADVARRSSLDVRPIDYATTHWDENYADRSPEEDPWQRTLAALDKM